MFDLVYPYLASPLSGLSCGQALVGALALSGTSTLFVLLGTLSRTHRLLQIYYVRGDWPGMVHHTEKGPGTVCGACGHHLAVHDRFTGRCCYGTPMELLAVCIALPLPRRVRTLVQQPGCACQLRAWGR